MNIHKQRLVIGEACGWKLGPTGWKKDNSYWDCYGFLPDYLYDLNAMHEAEKLLSVKQQHRYGRILHGMYKRSDMHPCYFALTATATHRAEAFLRTLGLWKES